MELMLDISNDILSQNNGIHDDLVTAVLKLLLDNHKKHSSLIEYWSLDGEPLDDCFTITPQIRNINKEKS